MLTGQPPKKPDGRFSLVFSLIIIICLLCHVQGLGTVKELRMAVSEEAISYY